MHFHVRVWPSDSNASNLTLPRSDATYHYTYEGLTPLYVQDTLNFDSDSPNSATVLQVIQNIYGTPQGSRIYEQGAYAPLLSDGLVQFQEDINIFIKFVDHFIAISLTIKLLWQHQATHCTSSSSRQNTKLETP